MNVFNHGDLLLEFGAFVASFFITNRLFNERTLKENDDSGSR